MSRVYNDANEKDIKVHMLTAASGKLDVTSEQLEEYFLKGLIVKEEDGTLIRPTEFKMVEGKATVAAGEKKYEVK